MPQDLNDNLSAWSEFFKQIDAEEEANRTLQNQKHKTLLHRASESWKSTKPRAPQPPAKASLASGEQQLALQACLTQALCILDEVQHMPAAGSLNSAFGDFQTLKDLLEEAHTQLQDLSS